MVSLSTLMRVLQNLLRESVSIRDLRTILETLGDWAHATQDPEILTEYVRHALSRTICAELAVNQTIPLITLAKPVEDAILSSVQHKETGSYLAIDPQTAQRIIDSIGKGITLFQGGQKPVLLAAPQIRPHVRKLVERYYPELVVISHNEVVSTYKVQSLGTVTLDAG